MIDTILNYFQGNGAITIGVVAFLSVYFILTVWIFVYKLLELNSIIKQEQNALEMLVHDHHSTLNSLSSIGQCIGSSPINKDSLSVCEISLIREASSGLSWQSIIASTAPFIGLFGTVVSILDTFTHIGQASGSMSIIASGVSDALIATASGIFVAVFAYTYHQILKRKAFEISNYLQMQSDAIIARGI